MIQNDPWAGFEQVSAPAQKPVGFIPGSPRQPAPQTPAQVQNDSLDTTLKGARVADIPLDRKNTQTSIESRQFGDRSGLRTEFNGLAEVKKYNAVLPTIARAMSAPETAQGDLSIIYAHGTAMDPDSVVRGEEMDMAKATASIPDQWKEAVNSISQGRRLPPEVRRGLIESIRNAGYSLNLGYSQARSRYREIAQRNGFDPEEVLGQHSGAGFQQIEANYKGAPVVNLDGSMGAQPQQRRQPGPGDIGFAGAEPLPGMKPEQETIYNAFWQNNPNPTPEQVRALGLAIGYNIENAEQIIEAKRQGLGVRPASDAVIKPAAVPEERKDDVLDPALRGVADVVTMGLSEEAAALVDTVGKGGTYRQNLADQNAVRDFDEDNNFLPRLGGQLVGGLALPTMGASGVRGIAKVGAGYGGAYGFGSADGGLLNRGANALLGAAAGGAVGAGIGAAGPLAQRGAASIGRRLAGPTTPEQNALLRAGEQEGVPVNMLDMYDGTRNAGATLETLPGASGPIRRGVEAGRDAMEARVGQLGGGGTPRGEGALGERVYKAGERFIEGHKTQSKADYGLAERLAGPDFKAEPVKAAAAARSVIGRLSELGNTNRSKIGLYQGVLGDLLDDAGNVRPLSIGAIKDMRRAIRDEMNTRGLVGSKDDADLQAIVDAAADDMFTALQARDPRAAAAYRRADQGYAERLSFIGGTLQKFMGTKDKPVSGEALVAKMKAMAGSGARGNSRELNQFMRVLTPEERADVAATWAAGLGRRSNEEPFSPNLFINSVRALDERARIVFFGRSGARSIQNLMKLAEAKKETIGRLNNSRSGQVVNYRTVISNLLLGVPGGGALAGAAAGIGGPTTAAVGIAASGGLLTASRGLAKAFMSEDFTRLVAQAPATTNPRAINGHLGRMRQLAAKDPNIRSVVEALEKGLLEAVNDNAPRATQAAASNGREDDNQR